MKKHNIYIYIKKIALGLLPISLVATSAIALSSCASTDSSESTNTNSVDQAFLTNQFANFKSLSEIEEYKKNITGKYFDLTKELLVKSGYCTKEDGITSPSIIYSKNQDSNKLKIDFVFDILRENQNERVEINNILTSVNLIKIKELPLIHELSLRPLTADKLATLTNDKLLETLKSINCGIDNLELITDSSVTLINGKNQFPIVASRDATPLTGFEIKLSLTCNENSIFMVENQISTLSNNFTKVIKNVKLSNEDKIAQSMWTFEDPTTKTIINGLSDFGKTQSRLIIPSNVSGIRKILLNKETNEIVK